MSYSINENCYHCRQCMDRCPAHAIGEQDGRLRIDPEVCVECGLCGRVCHFGAVCAPDGRVVEPEDVAPHEPQTIETDLVVIGGGASGVMAAVRAAHESGCRVVVLERTKYLGGCGWYGGGFRAYGSRAEKRLGIRDRRPGAIDRAVKDTFWQLDPGLIGKTYRALSEFVDWACDMEPSMETDFELFPPLVPGDEPDALVRPMNNIRSGGYYMLNVLLKHARKYDIRFLTQRRAVEIVRGEDGGVRAVRAQNPGGELTVRCRACMLAAGNWISNRKLCAQIVPEFERNRPSMLTPHMYPGCTGDGIFLAEKAGGYVRSDGLAARLFGPHIMASGGGLDFFGARFEGVLINRNGRRWVNEKKHELEAAPLLMRQPGCCAYTLLDAGILERIYENWKNGIGNEANGGPFVRDPAPDYREKIDAALESGTLPHKKADTLEQLAALIDVPADALEETVARYNGFCRSGLDLDFYKPAEYLVPFEKGPYYAVYGEAVSDGGFGGVWIDRELRALDTEKRPIPGLYAGGDNCCGWFVRLFGDKKSFINDLSWAFASGYMAGNSIAAYFENK